MTHLFMDLLVDDAASCDQAQRIVANELKAEGLDAEVVVDQLLSNGCYEFLVIADDATIEKIKDFYEIDY